MKVAILTLPLHTNYGGILQAYALQTVLQRMGHEVEVLQNTSVYSHNSFLMPLVYAKRIAARMLRRNNTPIFFEKIKAKEKPIVEQYTQKFVSNYINQRKIAALSDISSSDYDAFVVGSDQIWRKPYFCGMWHTAVKDAFLDFTKDWNIKRIAYAVSFGMDNINEYSQTDIKECREAIASFDAVSVREDSGVEICKSKLGIKADHVLDPTMLLDKEDYERIVYESKTPESQGDMLCYILDPSPLKNKIIEKVKTDKGLTPFNVFAEVDNIKLPLEERVQPPLESWLRGFMDAKFVVTDSFHACVFSIIFGKPFLAIGNSGRGMSRFTSLLSTFGLQNHLVFNESDFYKMSESKDNTHSDTIVQNREKSVLFLNANILK